MTSDKLIMLGVTLVFAIGSWILLGLFGIAIEAPVHGFVGWIGQTGGPWAILACIVAAFLSLAAFTLWSHRRDQARQFSADRTIHVEPSRWTPAFKRRFALLCLPVVIVAGKLVVDALVR